MTDDDDDGHRQGSEILRSLIYLFLIVHCLRVLVLMSTTLMGSS